MQRLTRKIKQLDIVCVMYIKKSDAPTIASWCVAVLLAVFMTGLSIGFNL